MKRLLFAFTLLASAASAANSFPGVQAIMSPGDFKRAGLDQLTPGQISLLDDLINRYQAGAVKEQAQQQAAQIVQQSQTSEIGKAHESFFSRFGLPLMNDDWRNSPSLSAKVVGWVGGNSFKLDNGQVWEGQSPIPFELAGRNVEIAPRPAGEFALIVEGKNTTIRVRRIQ